MKLRRILLVVFICMIALVGTVYAGTSYTGYNTTVAKIGGSGYSGYQTKATSGANGHLISTSVGGDYSVVARVIDTDWNGGDYTSWFADNTTRTLDGDVDHLSGDSVRVQFKNSLFTLVNVQVVGSWKSN